MNVPSEAGPPKRAKHVTPGERDIMRTNPNALMGTMSSQKSESSSVLGSTSGKAKKVDSTLGQYPLDVKYL